MKETINGDGEDRSFFNFSYDFDFSNDIEDSEMKKTISGDGEDGKLRRQDGIVGGVCGGLGRFFGIDPFWFRLLFVALLVPGGLPGFVPYVLLWLIIPARD